MQRRTERPAGVEPWVPFGPRSQGRAGRVQPCAPSCLRPNTPPLLCRPSLLTPGARGAWGHGPLPGSLSGGRRRRGPPARHHQRAAAACAWPGPRWLGRPSRARAPARSPRPRRAAARVRDDSRREPRRVLLRPHSCAFRAIVRCCAPGS